MSQSSPPPPPPHFLVLTYPVQSHVNPALHFARRLARTTGAIVTFTSSLFAHRQFVHSTTADPLSYFPFSDGYNKGIDFAKDGVHFIEHLCQVGPPAVSDILDSLAHDGRPVTCIVYTILLSWAANVARVKSISSLPLWIQPATLFTIYHRYFHDGFTRDDNGLIKADGLPPTIAQNELPSFIQPAGPYPHILSLVRDLFQTLDRESSRPQVLVNTFDALEGSVAVGLKAVEQVHMIGVGPLVPLSVNREGKTKTEDYSHLREYLDSKPTSSVVYVSFGTLSTLSERQMEEISSGLCQSGRPFLWVVRDVDQKWPSLTRSLHGEQEQQQSTTSEADECRVGVVRGGDLKGLGLVVSWCDQMEVLMHESVGCFVTHCGWNSSVEAITAGVPMVCVPQWSDQPTNAKMIEEVWRVGVRAKVGEGGVVEGEELRRCLDVVMGGGEKGEEVRRNARKWKDLAREALEEGGSSDLNTRALVERVKGTGENFLPQVGVE